MTLDQYAAIGEFIGGIGVVITLIYLALQIRQNTKTVKSSTIAANSQIWANMIMDTLDPKVMPAYLQGSLAETEMEPENFARFLFTCRAYFVNMESQWYQYQSGTLEPEIYLGYERSIQNQMLAFKGMRLYWQMFNNEFSPEFSAYIEGLLSASPQQPPGHLFAEWNRRVRESQTSGGE